MEKYLRIGTEVQTVRPLRLGNGATLPQGEHGIIRDLLIEVQAGGKRANFNVYVDFRTVSLVTTMEDIENV